MRDKGLDKSSIMELDTSDRNKRGWDKGFFGFRKMFWDYLKKLNVVFSDPCCDTAGVTDRKPLSFNEDTGQIDYWDGEAWTQAITTTTTTTTSTTTTTTLP